MARSDVNVINIKLLKQYHSNFTSEKNHFSNTTYKTFSNSYIKKCQDTYISKIARKLDECYKEVENLYRKIDNWWQSYNDEITNLENVLAGNTSSGVFESQGLREWSKSLPILEDYTVVFQDVIVKNSSVNIGYATPVIEKTAEEKMNDEKIKIQEEMSSKLSTITSAKLSPKQKFSCYKTTIDDEIKETKEQIVEILGFNTVPKDEILLGHIVMSLEAVNQEIRKLSFELAELNKKERYGNLDLINLKSSNTQEEIEQLIAQLEQYEYYKNLIIESMSDYLDLSIDDMELLLEFYDDFSDEEQEALICCPAILLLEEAKKFEEQKNYDKSVAVTGAVGLISVVEGLGQLAEGIYDADAIIATALNSVTTGLYDGAQALYGLITGNEWESTTKQMWDITKENVSKQHVTDTFDYFYESTTVGKFMKNSSYAFDTFRSVGNGIGYYGGAAVLTALTGGLGSLSMGTSTAVVTTVASTGKNTQDAWIDGADIGEGIAYGFARGAYDGLEVMIGSKISSLKLFNSFNSNLVNQLLNTGSHVALDSIDSASGGIIDPLLQMIYSPNSNNIEQIMYSINYDENGEKINDVKYEDLTFGEKYKVMFEYNGGWNTVKTNAIFGACTQ